MFSRQSKQIFPAWVRYALLPALALSMFSVATAADYPQPGDLAKGSMLWAENCGRCHQVRNPQDLRDDQWITTAFPMSIRAGLTGGETRDILTFLQASNAVIPTAAVTVTSVTVATDAPVQSGKEIYTQTCVACHGADGKGALPGAPDFALASGPLAKSDDALTQSILYGYQSPGSPMPMPAKGGNPSLDESGVAAVLKYLRDTFSH
ncbi:MAG: cytochrome c [Proteobacteria bacterium]|nr:cytochrome c [Pseudomonadota bacterium]